MDFLDNTLPDKSVQLIIADPPYFEVKGAFDFVWNSFDDYLADVEKWAIECKRLLADNGTLFWWGHAKRIAYSQLILDNYFSLENSMTWEKVDSMQYQYYSVDLSRTFNTHNERVLFYSNGEETTGLEYIEKEFVAPRNPFAIELKRARIEKGVSIKQVAEYGKFYGNVNHGGAVTNWERGYNVPQLEQWEILCNHLPIKRNYEDVKSDYDRLREEYEDVRREFEDLRRPFHNELKLTDVLRFSQEGHITKKYSHETKKPEKLTRALLLTCSRKDDTVLAPFAGSGTECAMAAKEGRPFIAFEKIEKHVKTATARCEEVFKNPTLF